MLLKIPMLFLPH